MPASVPTALQAQFDAMKAQAPVKADAPAMSVISVPEVIAPPMTAQAPQAAAPVEIVAQPPAVEMASASARLANTGSPDRGQQADPWEHKWKVADGMLKKTAAEAKAIREENQRLKEQLEQAQRQQPPAQGQLSAKPEDISDEELERLVKPDLLEEFGYDHWRQQIAIMRGMVQTNAAPVADPRLESIEEKFRKQEEDAFYNELDQLVPEWGQVYKTQPFQDFLRTAEGLTGASYNAILNDALDLLDAKRVAKIFRTFFSNAQQSPSQPDGFRSLVTPVPGSGMNQVKAGTITFAEWSDKLNNLNSRGLNPTEITIERNKLNAMWAEGRVTGIPPRG